MVFTSLMLILQPRIGGRATAAVIANGLWGLIGFGIAIVVLHLVARQLGNVPLALEPRACDLRDLKSRSVVLRPAQARSFCQLFVPALNFSA